jgi:oxaloacetate decarboxylase (Na+ extruding) subunit gamma
MQTTLFEQALELLVFGMGTVFVFLALLVIAVNVMSRVIETSFPEPIVLDVQLTRAKADNNLVDTRTLAIIQAAIRQHRDNNTRG